ncbi:hypothetical protein PspLS_09711 [Pyricularia sp. CBS 133598]|nr:hypothetical protein PspLS_09711 [Pyricularia sp. CBS 133598]
MATRRKKVFTTFSADPCRCFPKNRWSDWCEAQDGATSRPANWALGPPSSAKIRSPSRPLQWDCVNFRCWGRDLQGCVLGYFHGGSYCLSLDAHVTRARSTCTIIDYYGVFTTVRRTDNRCGEATVPWDSTRPPGHPVIRYRGRLHWMVRYMGKSGTKKVGDEKKEKKKRREGA